MHWNTSLLQTRNPFFAVRNDFGRDMGFEGSQSFAAMSVLEFSDRWVVSVEVPGLTEQDVSVTFHDGVLIIEGERKAVLAEGGKKLFNDRAFSGFRRVLRVNEAILQDSIEASMSDGVLTLILHRTPEKSPAKIAIRTMTQGQEG